MTENNVQAQVLSLQGSARIDGGRLALSIQLRNSSKSRIAVFDRPWDFDTYGVSAEIGRFFSQISLGADGLVTLGMVVPRTPPGMGVEQASIPCVTVMESGSDLNERIDVPLPLDEYSPYLPALPPAETTLVQSAGVAIAVDYVELTAELELAPGARAGCQEVRGFSRRMIVRARYPIPGVQVPVRRRNDSTR